MTGSDALAPPCAPPDFAVRVPGLRLPANACDCHAHVIGPAQRYPFIAERVYTPPDCLPSAYAHMRQVLGLPRAVLVQPSVYGTDNRLMLDTLAADPVNLRGVAVVAPDVPQQQLHDLHAAGVRGLRVNLVDRRDRDGKLPLDMLAALARRIAPMGWHLELLVHVDEHAAELAALGDLGVPVVLGHFGYQSIGAGGADAPGFQAMLRLLAGGSLWVKLTGPYRLTREGLPYAACDELAAALRETAPHRLLWGSDWPHVMLKGRMPNDAELVELLERWLPDAALREQVLVRNPEVLYGFGG
ncbi:MAG TPA: amidohydrolase family protein [Ramlibacter sp.]|nr:amidohydrolase family protein [Ramlibacter sp.]